MSTLTNNIYVHFEGPVHSDSQYLITSQFNYVHIPYGKELLESISFISHDLTYTDYIDWTTHFNQIIKLAILVNGYPMLRITSLIAFPKL